VKWERDRLAKDPDFLNSVRVVFTVGLLYVLTSLKVTGHLLCFKMEFSFMF